MGAYSDVVVLSASDSPANMPPSLSNNSGRPLVFFISILSIESNASSPSIEPLDEPRLGLVTLDSARAEAQRGLFFRKGLTADASLQECESSSLALNNLPVHSGTIPAEPMVAMKDLNILELRCARASITVAITN